MIIITSMDNELKSGARLLLAATIGIASSVGLVYMAGKEMISVKQLDEKRISLEFSTALDIEDPRVRKVMADVKAKCQPKESPKIGRLKVTSIQYETVVNNCGRLLTSIAQR